MNIECPKCIEERDNYITMSYEIAHDYSGREYAIYFCECCGYELSRRMDMSEDDFLVFCV